MTKQSHQFKPQFITWLGLITALHLFSLAERNLLIKTWSMQQWVLDAFLDDWTIPWRILMTYAGINAIQLIENSMTDRQSKMRTTLTSLAMVVSRTHNCYWNNQRKWMDLLHPFMMNQATPYLGASSKLINNENRDHRK